MKAFQNPYRRPAAPEPVKQKLPVVVHPDHNPLEFDELLEEKHYLGANCRAGDYLRQRVYLHGELVTLIAWGPVATHSRTATVKLVGIPPNAPNAKSLWCSNGAFSC